MVLAYHLKYFRNVSLSLFSSIFKLLGEIRRFLNNCDISHTKHTDWIICPDTDNKFYTNYFPTLSTKYVQTQSIHEHLKSPSPSSSKKNQNLIIFIIPGGTATASPRNIAYTAPRFHFAYFLILFHSIGGGRGEGGPTEIVLFVVFFCWIRCTFGTLARRLVGSAAAAVVLGCNNRRAGPGRPVPVDTCRLLPEISR